MLDPRCLIPGQYPEQGVRTKDDLSVQPTYTLYLTLFQILALRI